MLTLYDIVVSGFRIFDLAAKVFGNSHVWIKTKFQSLVVWP